MRIKQHKYFPKQFQSIHISKKESESMVLSEGRWILKACEREASNEEFDNVQALVLANKALIEKLTDKKSCVGFVNLLEVIPNFHIQLTEEEKEVVGESSNVLVLGRSGTGKTTCAILRLFASEVLFRYRAH